MFSIKLITLTENDKIICDGENSGKQIQLFSQSLMVINQADGECLQQFYPVRVQSCMDRSKVRMEPVTITELPQNIVQISMLVQQKINNWSYCEFYDILVLSRRKRYQYGIRKSN